MAEPDVTALRRPYSSRKLTTLLDFFERDPAAHSRNSSLNDMDAVGYRSLPLSDETERSEYIRIAVSKGLLEDDRAITASAPDGATGFYIGYTITQTGREFLEQRREARLRTIWWRQIITNLPTIAVSVVVALLTQWLLRWLGPAE